MVQKPYNFELQNPKVLVILRWVHFEIQNTNLTFWKLCSYYIYAKILRTNSYPLYLDSACNLVISCTSWCKILSIIHTTQSAFWVSRLSVSIELYGCTTTSLMSSCETTIHLLSEIQENRKASWRWSYYPLWHGLSSLSHEKVLNVLSSNLSTNLENQKNNY